MPLLSFTFTLDHPPRVHQRLHVYPDGAVWLWATLPGGERHDHGAGTYRYTLDPEALTAATAIAEALLVAPAPSAPAALPVLGVIEAGVTAASGGAERTHVYTHVAADDLSPAVRDAHAFAVATISHAEAEPFAVIRLAIEVKHPLLDRGQRGTLQFVFGNPGTEPVSFTVAPDSLRARRRVGDEWQDVWQLAGEPLLGLVGPDGAFLDGLLVPATLAPGATASLTFLDAVDLATSGSSGGELGGVAAGTIALIAPPGTAPDQRLDPYRMQSA